MGEPEQRYAESEKPDTKGQRLYDSTYTEYLEQASSQKQRGLEVTRGYGEWEVGRRRLMNRVCIPGDEKFWKYTVVTATQHGECN